MMNLPYSAMMCVLRYLTPPVSVLYYWTDYIDYSCVNVYPRYFSTLNIYIFVCVNTTQMVTIEFILLYTLWY